jgi:hypothetical protein
MGKNLTGSYFKLPIATVKLMPRWPADQQSDGRNSAIAHRPNRVPPFIAQGHEVLQVVTFLRFSSFFVFSG